MLVNIDDETLALFETLIKCDEDREDTINILVLSGIEQSVLNGFEEIATIDKLQEMLNSQEKELIQDKKIKCVVLDGMEAPMDIPREVAQDIIRELWRIADEKQKI